MSNFDVVTTIVLLCISVAVWFIPATIYCVRRIRNRTANGSLRKLGVSKMLVFSGCLLVSVWCLRYAVGYYSVLFPEKDVAPLYWWEEIFNSIVHALQTFSMDEDYTEYIRTGKKMIAAAFGAGEGWQIAYGVYASALNVAAPIAGGAIVLEVLARIFPEVQLRMSFHLFWRKKYYFSELNPASLALAKSISQEMGRKRPVLVFTDTYVDDEKEREYELLLEAKRYGAICVRKDLAHVPKPMWGKREFYLMDENEFGNLQTLLGLMEDRNLRYLKDSCIYLFVQTDAYVQIEKRAKQILEEKKDLLGDGEKPIIVPVRGYRNLVQNLLNTVPLYEPLVHQKGKDHLQVTILGNGIIGTEAFLNTYWMGQMMVSGESSMKPCDLTVNVISKDTREDFWARIDYVNPDIRKTVAEGEKIGNLLAVNENGDRNPPYCRVNYTQMDLKTGGFWTDNNPQTEHLLDSDYYIVALGSDSDNITIAEKLCCLIGKKHVEQCQDVPAQAVIAYAVFDSELTTALNREKTFTSLGNGAPDIYMHAFGNLEQVYSCDNVYMSRNLLWATETGTAFLQGKYDNSHRLDNIERNNAALENYENANYSYWASLARAMHMKYKLFSLGWIQKSLFDCRNAEQYEAYRKEIQEQCARYQRFSAACANKLELADEEAQSYQQLERKKECLAWLEHRRWNAFTRTMGYQYVDVDKILIPEKNCTDHKNMRLKLHACLVEARMPDYEKGEVFLTTGTTTPDFLDKVTGAKRKIKENTTDLKRYDYYDREFDNFKPEEKLRAELEQQGVQNPEKYCDHRLFKDSFSCDTAQGTVYLVPIEAVRWMLETEFVQVDKTADYQGQFTFQKLCYAPKRSVWLKLKK